MTRRKMRQKARRQKAEISGQGSVVSGQNKLQAVAYGRISGGISETYIPFRAMPGVDEICTVAIRRVVKAIKNEN